MWWHNFFHPFPVPFGSIFQILFFKKKFRLFFSMSGNFFTVRDPPFFGMLFLIAQIKRFGTLNATQKTVALYEAIVFEKNQEKLTEIVHF